MIDNRCVAILLISALLIFYYISQKDNMTSLNNLFHGRKLHFISYGNDRFKKQKKRIEKDAINTKWFHTVRVYGPEDIPEEIKMIHPVTKEYRGNGYWYWKIYLLFNELMNREIGSYIVYSDAGSVIDKTQDKKLLKYLKMIDESKYDNLSLPIPFIENEWTTKELFNAFGLKPDSVEGKSYQIEAGTLIFKNTEHSRVLVKHAFDVFMKDPLLISDEYGKRPQIPKFKENRHDQSILSLAKKIHGTVISNDNMNNGKDDRGAVFRRLKIRE